MANLKGLLKGKITSKELELLPTSFDLVGDILIFSDFPKYKLKTEKLIANVILKKMKNVKVVAKKVKEHAGIYRTKKLKIIGGEKRKETVYMENGVKLKLNVESCYFSPRLSTERMRVAKQVKAKEDVLVMFSGVGPYPIVIAKHSNPRNIYGVEINPAAHCYALENRLLNKMHNIFLIKGDVRQIIPSFYRYIIGLKSSDNIPQLKARLVEHPAIMEFHLYDSDLFERQPLLEKEIKRLQKKGIEIILHQPFRYKGELCSLLKEDITGEALILNKLGMLCKKYNVKAVVHPHFGYSHKIKNAEKNLINNLKLFDRYYDYFFFENMSQRPFSKASSVLRVARAAKLKNIAIDLSHAYLVYKDNDKVLNLTKKLRKEFNTYFHINDSDGKTDSVEIGKGKIDFKKILPYVNKGVTEVRSKDEGRPFEMLRSYKKIQHLHKIFDRVVMPLPSGADSFLDLAFKVSKKGTIVHFYDFLNNDEFDLAVKKIKKVFKKVKILNIVKCGQFSPRKYRVCVDFLVV